MYREGYARKVKRTILFMGLNYRLDPEIQRV